MNKKNQKRSKKKQNIDPFLKLWNKIKESNDYIMMKKITALGKDPIYPLNHLNEYEKNKDSKHLIKYYESLKISTSRWLDKDKCFCESGKYIWKCHLEGKENTIIETIEENQRKFLFKVLSSRPFSKKCLIEECQKVTINSHYIPKNMLKIFGTNLIEVKMSENHDQRKRGIKLISHKMFCKDHDNSIFSKVDKYPFELNKENLKLFTIRMIYMELTQKMWVVNSMKKLFMKNIAYSGIPNIIEQYKGNKLGIKDLRKSIKNIMTNSNNNVIYKIFNSKNIFISGTCYNPKNYSENEKVMYDIHNTQIEIPVIATVICPWGKQMIAISVFTKDKFNNEEFNFVSKLSDTDLKKWFSAQILNGQNFWAKNDDMISMTKKGLLNNIQIKGMEGTQIEIYNNHYKLVPNIFDD